MDYTYGIDVSHWTDKLDYDKLIINGYGTKKLVPVFNFAKATEGKSYKDTLYSYHITNSKRVGILTGAYMYYREQYKPQEQGKLFAQVYNDNGGTDLPPVIDVEIINNQKLTPSKVADCINEIVEHTGRQPIIYTGRYVWRDDMKGAKWGSKYKLWLADYTAPPDVPDPWTNWTFWQFSDSKGDENWYNGSLAQLKAEFGISTESTDLINNETPVSVEPTREERIDALIAKAVKEGWIA